MRDTVSSALAWVASRCTGGATPAKTASFQRTAQRHQRSPGLSPANRYSGRGVIRSFPCASEYEGNRSTEHRSRLIAGLPERSMLSCRFNILMPMGEIQKRAKLLQAMNAATPPLSVGILRAFAFTHHAHLPIGIKPCKMTSAAVARERASLTPAACVGVGNNGMAKKCAARSQMSHHARTLTLI